MPETAIQIKELNTIGESFTFEKDSLKQSVDVHFVMYSALKISVLDLVYFFSPNNKNEFGMFDATSSLWIPIVEKSGQQEVMLGSNEIYRRRMSTFGVFLRDDYLISKNTHLYMVYMPVLRFLRITQASKSIYPVTISLTVKPRGNDSGYKSKGPVFNLRSQSLESERSE